MNTIFYLGNNDNIYKIKKVKQVFIYRKKKAVITMLFINLDGKVLFI